MSAHELCVTWPAFFRAREELSKRLADLEGSVSPEQFDSQFQGGNSVTMGGGR